MGTCSNAPVLHMTEAERKHFSLQTFLKFTSLPCVTCTWRSNSRKPFWIKNMAPDAGLKLTKAEWHLCFSTSGSSMQCPAIHSNNLCSGFEAFDEDYMYHHLQK